MKLLTIRDVETYSCISGFEGSFPSFLLGGLSSIMVSLNASTFALSNSLAGACCLHDHHRHPQAQARAISRAAVSMGSLSNPRSVHQILAAVSHQQGTSKGRTSAGILSLPDSQSVYFTFECNIQTSTLYLVLGVLAAAGGSYL